MTTKTIHVYLAGPDVFFPDAVGVGERKKAHLAELGLIGHYPFDNEIPAEAFADPRKAAHLIADANEKMMLECCRPDQIGVILVNMSPFRGPIMDAGTAFEAGFMAALSHQNPNILIIGYSDDERLFEERMAQDIYGGQTKRHEGRLFAPDGTAIESFGGRENLMVTGAIERTGGKIFNTFEEAALFAKQAGEKRLAQMKKPLGGATPAILENA